MGCDGDVEDCFGGQGSKIDVNASAERSCAANIFPNAFQTATASIELALRRREVQGRCGGR
jgi:hypothetical protein